MSAPYVTGTVTVTAGSAIVTGVGTAFLVAGIVGGFFGADRADGNPLPILSVDSDTQITLALPWRGATAGGQPYWIVRDTAYLRQVSANSQMLSNYLARLDKQSVTALSSVAGLADTMFYFTGPDSGGRTALTAFARSILDDPDAATMRATLGVQSSEYGSNANGSYLRLSDGTQLTWGAQINNGSWAPGVSATPSIIQPAAFIAAPKTKADVGFFSGVNGAGSRLYGLKFSFYEDASGLLREAILQSGLSPAASYPGFTLGATAAQSLFVEFLSIGRWK